MTREEVVRIAEEFNEWLDYMAEKHNEDKDDIQEIIKQFFM